VKEIGKRKTKRKRKRGERRAQNERVAMISANRKTKNVTDGIG